MMKIVVLADCHIHPGNGPNWTDAALAAFAGADLILTLGDMGEAAGLEPLAGIARVQGVRGGDDQASPYTEGRTQRLTIDGVAIGMAFDPVAEGLATSGAPLALASAETRAQIPGGGAEVLLWASTHFPEIGRQDGVLTVNPGSATLPDKGSAASFARLTVADGKVGAEIVSLT
ncbi:MAG TPA: metallophosphoesterase family protein [Caulobacteraceae bacterium]|jgi:putative phosphoesterase